jgi:hypothetical protein
VSHGRLSRFRPLGQVPLVSSGPTVRHSTRIYSGRHGRQMGIAAPSRQHSSASTI